jgi:hypothetical protein
MRNILIGLFIRPHLDKLEFTLFYFRITKNVKANKKQNIAVQDSD